MSFEYRRSGFQVLRTTNAQVHRPLPRLMDFEPALLQHRQFSLLLRTEVAVLNAHLK
jgi:hypothetical protein